MNSFGGRFVAVNALWIIVVAVLLYFALGPHKFIRKGSPLHESLSPAGLKKVELVLRGIFVLIAILYFAFSGFRILADTISFAGRSQEVPVKVATVKAVRNAAFGMWMLHRSIKINDAPNSYKLDFSVTPVLVGSKIEMRYLPRSRSILIIKTM